MTEYRDGLPPRPAKVERLPLSDKGYPVPFFVGYVNGKPDFRVIDPTKMRRCVLLRLCWVCGQPLGSFLAFNIGPLAFVNRISGEPPSHRECAEYASTACPFLRLPKASYRTANMPEIVDKHPASMEHNPGAGAVYVCGKYKVEQRKGEPPLFLLGPPSAVLWFSQGRPAMRDEVEAGLALGLPELERRAALAGENAVRLMHQNLLMARSWFPQEQRA